MVSIENMFKRYAHEKDTRGNGSHLLQPKARIEAGSKTFAFQGALIFNGLLADLWKEPYFINFKQRLDSLGFV